MSFTGNYTAYVSAYNGDNHIESNLISFSVVSSENSLHGDLNTDSKLSVLDTVFLQKYVLRLKNLTEAQLQNADLNSDGKVNVLDLVLLKRAITSQ